MSEKQTVSYLAHHGAKGMKWHRRLYQNEDGSLTPLGRERYGSKVRDGISKGIKSVKSLGKNASGTDKSKKVSGEKKVENFLVKKIKSINLKDIKEKAAQAKKETLDKIEKVKKEVAEKEKAKAQAKIDAENQAKIDAENERKATFEELRAKHLKYDKQGNLLPGAPLDLYTNAELKAITERRNAENEYLKVNPQKQTTNQFIKNKLEETVKDHVLPGVQAGIKEYVKGYSTNYLKEFQEKIGNNQTSNNNTQKQNQQSNNQQSNNQQQNNKQSNNQKQQNQQNNQKQQKQQKTNNKDNNSYTLDSDWEIPGFSKNVNKEIKDFLEPFDNYTKDTLIDLYKNSDERK